MTKYEQSADFAAASGADETERERLTLPRVRLLKGYGLFGADEILVPLPGAEWTLPLHDAEALRDDISKALAEARFPSPKPNCVGCGRTEDELHADDCPHIYNLTIRQVR